MRSNLQGQQPKLLRLIPKGEAVFAQLSDHIAALAETLAEQEDAAQLQNAVVVAKHLHEQLRAMLNQ